MTAIAAAVERDPGFWRYRYDEALLRAAAGLDPRPAARAARRLNPREPQVRVLNGGLAAAPPSEWERGAREAIEAERR